MWHYNCLWALNVLIRPVVHLDWWRYKIKYKYDSFLLLDEILDVQIVSVEAAVELIAGNPVRCKCTRIVVPDPPQFKAKPVNCSPRSPVV